MTPEDQARAGFYGLLARLFYAPPDANLIAELLRAPAPRAEGERPTSEGEALESAWRALMERRRQVRAMQTAETNRGGLLTEQTQPSQQRVLAFLATELAQLEEQIATLIATDPERVPGLANPPSAGTAHMGQMRGEARDKAAAEGARTVPPREHGGNCDIKDLSRGAKVFFPVYVDGAGLSVGDLHVSQGDGEITFCGAIEMAGWVHMKVGLIKGGMAKYGIKNPIFKPSPITPRYDDYLIFEGISVDEAGKQHYLDVHIAYRQACLNAIEYLTKFGYTKAQAYAILGTAPVQGHISGVVDIPNACATLWLPTDIFEFDVMPSAAGPIKHIKPGPDIPMSPDK